MAILSPVLRQRFFDSSGNPLAGGLLWSFAAGTSTPLDTYDQSGAANTNPVVLDSSGYADVWLSDAVYKLVLTAAGGDPASPIWSRDNITSGNFSQGGFTGPIGQTTAYPGTFTTLEATTTNGAVNASRMAGADFGIKLTAAIAALPSTGGVVDARELTGAQSLSANVTISKKHVRILFGNVTLAMGGFIFSIPAGTDGLALEGQPGYGGSDPVATAGGTYFVNTGNLSAIQVGSSASDTFGFMASDICVVTVTGGTTAQGFQLNRCINYRLKQCRVVMLATASTQYGIVLDGSGATYTSGIVYQPYISNGNKGIYFTGTAPNAANANQIIGGVVTGATAGSAIGIDLAQGDGNCILGTDIEGYATGIRLAGSAGNNFIVARLEANTTAVSCEASSSGNEIHISDPAAVVTDAGTSNVIYRGGTRYLNAINTITTANGAQWIQGSISEEIILSTSGTTTDSAANLLPGNSIIEAVAARVTTTIATATDWKMGDATQAARFSSAFGTLAAGTIALGLNHADPTVASANLGPVQTSPAKLRITTTGTPSAGKIRVTVFYRQFFAPTS